jgi:hypothetical protein
MGIISAVGGFQLLNTVRALLWLLMGLAQLAVAVVAFSQNSRGTGIVAGGMALIAFTYWASLGRPRRAPVAPSPGLDED